jgi:DNA-binding GntR family transcriptional regulator
MVNTKDEIYADLRGRIITNALRPGEMLNEKELMQHYDIGRTPLREVLLRLQADGLIQMLPRLGTMVTPLNIVEIREFVEIRRELEGLAGRLAAERSTAAQRQRLGEILARADGLTDDSEETLRKLTELDNEFHHVLYDATKNRKLKTSLAELNGLMVRFWYHLGFQRQEFADQFEDLRIVLQALETRNPERAAHAMKTHIDRFVDRVKTGVL